MQVKAKHSSLSALLLYLHSGGGQVGVLVLKSSVQGQASLLLVVSQQRTDGYGILIGAIGFHCFSVAE